MTSDARTFRVEPHGLAGQVTALGTIGDQTNDLVTSANRLAERSPMLGTAPPALHLSQQLRTAAGESGLAGEIGAVNTEVAGFHQALSDTLTNYLHDESHISGSFHHIAGTK